jgi:hypothetical protein
MVNEKLVTEVLKIEPLIRSIEVCAYDDKVDNWNNHYDDKWVIQEASYILSTFFEKGHENNFELTGYYGEDLKKQSKKQVVQLKKLINKWKFIKN